MKATCPFVFAAVAGLLSACQASPEQETPPAPTAASVSTLSLEVGTCLNDVDQPLAQDLTEIPAVDCAFPHQSEVFAEILLDDGDFPGVDRLVEQAVNQCEAEFGRFIGIDYRQSQLSYHFYYPTARTWSEGDRSLFCVVFDPGVDSVGSLEGVAR